MEEITNAPSNSSSSYVDNQMITGDLSKSGSIEKKHETGNDRLSNHGRYFAQQIAVLFFYRGHNCGIPYYFGYEHEHAGKFDDFVFQYEKGGRMKYRFIQAKHGSTKGNQMIKLDDLKSQRDANDFSLQKYFVSYIKIINKDEFKDGDIEDFIICTNKNFSFISREHNDGNHEKWKHCLIEKTDEDAILNLGGKLYQFSTGIIEEIKDLFEDALKRNKLKVDPEDLKVKIREFLKLLVFAIKQPSGETLEMKIKETMSKELKLIPNITYERFFKNISKWMKEYEVSGNKKVATYLTHKDWKKWVNDVKSDIATITSTERIKNYKSKFIEEIDEFKEMSEFLESQGQILIIYAKYALLSEIKVWQVVEKKGLDYIFWDLSLQESSEVEAFKNPSRNLLIISGCNLKDKGNALKCFFNLLEENSKKKIILICSEEVPFDWFNEISPEKILKKIEDNSSNFTDLNSETREYLLEKSIAEFQGTEVKLSELINNDTKYIFGELLCKIIKSEKIEIGSELMDSKYKQIRDYYIERKLYRHVGVNESLMNNDSQFFIINNDNKDRKSELKDDHDILLISDEEDDFKKLCDEHKNHNVHQLRKIGNNLVWQQSRGSLSKIREIINKNDQNSKIHEVNDITRINDKVVIIAAEPGIGKSTVLTHLAVQIKKSDPSLWLFKLNLADYQDILSAQERFNEEEAVVKFLYRIVGSQLILKKPEETEEENKERIENLLNSISVKDNMISIEDNGRDIDDISSFKVNLFKEYYNEGKIIFLFDGFDEISPDYGIQFKEVLKVLKDCRSQIWTTTRPYNIAVELENELNVFSYSLTSLSIDDQEEFLKRFWNISLDKKSCKIFIEELLNRFSESTKDIKRNFVSNPLQIYMLAKNFKNIFLEWYRSGEEGFSEEYKNKCEQITLVSLYKEFIDVKYNEIWCKKNPELNPETSKIALKKKNVEIKAIWLENHRKLAAYAQLGKDEIKLFLSEQELKEISDIINEIKCGEEKVGIITKIVNNKPEFVHLTFAEYFLFDFIQKRLFSSEVTKEIWKFVLTKIFTEDKYFVVRRFFNDHLQLQSVEVDHDQSEYIKDILRIETPPIPLHVASEEGLEAILQFLFKYQPDVEGDAMVDKNIADYFLSDFLQQLEGKCSEDEIKYFSEVNPDYIAHRIFNGDIQLKDQPCLKKPYEIDKYIDMYRNDVKVSTYLSYVKNKIKMYHFANIYYNHRTALTRAIKNHQKLAAEILVKNGAYIPPDYFELFIDHPLFFEIVLKHIKINGLSKFFLPRTLACAENSFDFAVQLIDEDSNVKEKYNRGLTVLHVGADSGDEELVKMLIRKDADVNAKDIKSNTPLHLAAERGKEEVVKILLDKGADVNAENINRDTPLLLAARSGEEEIVEILLDKGADVNAENINRDTPLLLAARSGEEEIVKILLDKGADVNAENINRDTPLLLAARSRKEKVVEILLDKGADVNAENIIRDTPLLSAALSGKEKVVEILLDKGADVNAMNSDSDTLLHIAARLGREEIVKILLDKGADVNAKESCSYTPLHVAAVFGKEKVVEILLDKGADVNAENIIRDTPLLSAALSGKEKVVEILLDKGADVNAMNSDSDTPLHLAARLGREEIVEILLDKGADVNAMNSDSDTPLHLAARLGREEIVKIILDKGADVNAKSISSDTPLHLAAQICDEEVVKIILDKGADVNAKNSCSNTPLHLAAQFGKMEVVKILLDKGADVNARNSSGDTPLYLAEEFGKEEVVKILLDKGADVNAKSISSDTPLHLAAQICDEEVVKSTLDKGADVNAKNYCSNTPLHLAAKFGKKEIVKILLDKGADVNARNSSGDTPLYLAEEFGKEEVVKILLDKGADVIAENIDNNTPVRLADS